MKESVVDIYDLQEAAPFFKSRFGYFSGESADQMVKYR